MHAGHDPSSIDGQFHGPFDEARRCAPFAFFLYPSAPSKCRRSQPPPSPAGLFHVEECGDDINNCEEQVIYARFLPCNSSQPFFLCSVGPRAKISWTTTTTCTVSRALCARAVPHTRTSSKRVLARTAYLYSHSYRMRSCCSPHQPSAPRLSCANAANGFHFG